jgi:transposase
MKRLPQYVLFQKMSFCTHRLQDPADAKQEEEQLKEQLNKEMEALSSELLREIREVRRMLREVREEEEHMELNYRLVKLEEILMAADRPVKWWISQRTNDVHR